MIIQISSGQGPAECELAVSADNRKMYIDTVFNRKGSV